MVLLLSILCSTLANVSAQTGPAIVHLVHAPGCDTTLSLERVKALPTHNATITAHDGEQATYTGAFVWDVLAAGCPSATNAPKRDRIGMVVRVDAWDDYHAVLALMEADTSFRQKPVLLCWEKNGAPLVAHDGPFQLIVPDDQRHARDVRQVKSLTVLTP